MTEISELTRDQIEAYCKAFDEAWMAIEEATQAIGKLNDLLYAGEALIHRADRPDVHLLRQKAKGLNGELACFYAAENPLKLPVVLPGERRYVVSKEDLRVIANGPPVD